jgi:serine/threonine-protein kinase
MERLLNGRYQLIGPVGSGGMATVYKARDNVLGRTVAVKVLREQYVHDAQFVARFRREAQAAANLAHPNIVNVYDVGQDGDLHYIVMEFIAGDNLKALIKRSAPLSIDRAVSVAIQMLAGLEYAHRSGLIHRDVKPQNVVITAEGSVKVTDFGIAKSVSDLGLTEAGTALGTAHYFSPEQAKGERVLPQSDIYAVGVTLYEMLTGHLPFESDSVMGLAFKHISEAPRPPRQLNPSVPARLEAIVLKALAKEPSERFTTAADMEKALRVMLSGGERPTVEVPIAQGVVAQSGGRPVPRANPRSGRVGASGPTTDSLRGNGATRNVYPMAAGGGVAAAGVATRHVTSGLGGPTSMTVRPSPSRSGGVSCAAVGIGLFLVGLLVIVLVGAVYIGPQLPVMLRDYVVPSPTATPITPTATPIPPSPTATYTPTATPTATATATNTPISVPVPQLVGLKIQDAIALAQQSDFLVVELERIESREWPEGVVAQQDPPEKTMLMKTMRISVRVSNGPPPFKLPQLSNTDPDAARTTLEGAGVRVRLAYEGSATVPKGVVIRSDPPGDTNVRPGDTVTLVISRGEVVEVPDLRLMANADLAQDTLEQRGLFLGTITEVDDPTESVPPGAVLAQDPAQGTVVEKGTVVNITIRRKPPPEP